MGMFLESTVSIIVPLYQGNKYVPRLIQMAEACKEKAGDIVKIELVLSNDDPDEKIDESVCSEAVNVFVMNTMKNRGIQKARIRGFDMGTGEYVVFLDQDDIVYPHYISSQLSQIGSADAVICRAVNGGRLFYNHDRSFEEMTSFRHMFSKGNGILSPGQVLMRREAVSRFWKENTLQHNGSDDWLLWLCMLYEGSRFVRNQDILYEHILGGGNCSASAFKMYQSEKEMYEVIKKQGYLDTGHLTQLRQAIQKGTEVRLKELDRLKTMAEIYDTWLAVCEGTSPVVLVLKHMGCRTVAIYGMGKMGLRLYQEIGAEIEVKCFIDRNAAYLRADIPIYTLEDDIPQVDLVIIALADRENKILADVSSRLRVPVKGIENILQEILTKE